MPAEEPKMGCFYATGESLYAKISVGKISDNLYAESLLSGSRLLEP